MITPSSLRLLSAAFAAALAVSSASAALLVSDDFNYTAGGLSTNNGGTGWAGAWGAVGAVNNVQVEATGLSVNITGYSMAAAGNSISSSAGSTFAARAFNDTLATTDGSTYFFSMLINVAAIDSNNRAIRLFNTAGASNAGFGVNLTATTLVLGINSAAGTFTTDLTVKTNNTTQLMVGKVTFSDTAASDRFDVWLFDDGADITSVNFNTNSTNFVTGDYVVGQNGVALGRGDTADLYELDAFYLGTTADSVLGAVPEPSSFAALAGLGALGFAALRRRRA
jgi:hypothetical protein